MAAYRDSFRLLIAFAHRKLRKSPSDMTIDDFDTPLILAFLKYLEDERHNCIRSRNARFAAIRAFMQYVAFEEPSAVALARSVQAIKMKRFERPMVRPASAIARASLKSFLMALTFVLTNCAGMSRTWWPCAAKRRPQNWEPEHGSIATRQRSVVAASTTTLFKDSWRIVSSRLLLAQQGQTH